MKFFNEFNFNEISNFLMNLTLIVMKFPNITPDNPTIIHIEFSFLMNSILI